MENTLKWQGEPIIARFGFSIVKENKDKPMWWYNFECNVHQNSYDEYIPSYGMMGIAAIPAIEVTQHEQTFVIANHFGIGWHKLINGGSPTYSHFSITDGKFSQDNGKEWVFKEFDEEGFVKHESERSKWQKENFPEEWQNVQALKSAMRSHLTKLKSE